MSRVCSICSPELVQYSDTLLAEPMLRICVEVKCHTAEPIRLLVEFLRYWFSREELEEKLPIGLTQQQLLTESRTSIISECLVGRYARGSDRFQEV